MNRSLHILPDCSRSKGGPSNSVPALIDALNATGVHKAKLFTAATSSYDALELEKIEGITCKVVNNKIDKLIFILRIFKTLQNDKTAIVHIHSIFNFVTSVTALYCLLLSRKYVVQPRGMLEPWSLMQSRIRKMIFLKLFGNIMLKKSQSVICTSKNEMNGVISICRDCKPIIIPNIQNKNYIAIDFDEEAFPKAQRKDTFVFFSRLHPKKNLGFLLDIFSDPSMDQYSLAVYGYNDSDFSHEIIHEINKMKNVEYLGELDHTSLNTLRQYEALLFPSYSENFGMVILEALSIGLPVIINEDLPWSDHYSEVCVTGLVLERQTWIREIKRFLGSKNTENSHIFAESCARVTNHFQADRIACRLIGAYNV